MMLTLVLAVSLAGGAIAPASPAAARVVSNDALVQRVWEQRAPKTEGLLVMLKAELDDGADGAVAVTCTAVMSELPGAKLAGSLSERVELVGTFNAKRKERMTEACVGALADSYRQWLAKRK